MWKQRFKLKILNRGYRYYFYDKAKILSNKDNILECVVSGNKDYSVKIDKYNRTMFCDCPYAKKGNNCKHMVASIYEYNSKKGEKICQYSKYEFDIIIDDIFDNEDGIKIEEQINIFFSTSVRNLLIYGFNTMAFDVLLNIFVKLTYNADKFEFLTYINLIDYSIEYMKKALKGIDDAGNKILLNNFVKEINGIKESDNPIKKIFLIKLKDIFEFKYIEQILLDNIEFYTEEIIEILFEGYFKDKKYDKIIKLAKKYEDQRISYIYLVRTYEKKEEYKKVIKTCKKALEKITKGNSVFLERLIDITRGIDKYFDEFVEASLIKFENIHFITFEDYKLICENMEDEYVGLIKIDILENSEKTNEYAKILYYEEEYEEILKLHSCILFKEENIKNYLLKNYNTQLYDKLNKDIMDLSKNLNNYNDYIELSEFVNYLTLFENGYEKRDKMEQKLLKKYKNDKELKYALSYI